MANFNEAVKVVLKNEGKYCDDPHDAGHATNYGISLRFLMLSGIDINHDSVIDVKDILAITPFEAKNIYKEEWWDKYQYEHIDSQPIATKIFDLAVNMGAKQSHKLAQRAINEIGSTIDKFQKIAQDGIMGTNTIYSINFIDNGHKELQLLQAIKNAASRFYMDIALVNPKLHRFLGGWLNRAKC